MNRKGSLWLSVIVGIMVFMAGMLILNHFRPEVTTLRNASNLDCTNVTISDGTKLTCLGVDLVVPGLIVVIISLAASLVVGKFLT